MEAVLDTVCLHHILRTQKVIGQKNKKKRAETCLDIYMRKGKLVLAFDNKRGLLSEWEETCGIEVVAVFISKWEPYGAITFEPDLPVLKVRIRKKLRALGFEGTIDMLIIRIALAKQGRVLVSDDNHFWDPRSKDHRGNKNSPVARLCREELQVIIMLVSTLLEALK